MSRSRTLPIALVACLAAPSLYAQSAELRRVEVGFGAVWHGGTRFGSVDATETAADGSPFRLFSTSTTLERASGVEGRVGFRVRRALQAEVSGSYVVPQLATRIDSDFEGAPALTAREPIKEVAVEGALVWHVGRWSIGRRMVPFVRGGLGYLRAIHDGQTLITSGGVSELGGGLNIALKGRIGVRVDARAVVRQKAVGFDDRAHVSTAVGSSLFARF